MKVSTHNLFLKLLFELDESILEHRKQEAPQIIINDLEQSRRDVLKAFNLLINEIEVA